MKQMFWRIAMVVAALLMAGCTTTQDQGSKADKDTLFSTLDVNHNDKITKEEFVARTGEKNKASEIFDKCDSGKQGYLTYDEVWANACCSPRKLS
jgi:Ca2+-binding EF-hand superfamily protein